MNPHVKESWTVGCLPKVTAYNSAKQNFKKCIKNNPKTVLNYINGLFLRPVPSVSMWHFTTSPVYGLSLTLPFPWRLRHIVGTHHFIYLLNTQVNQKSMCIPDSHLTCLSWGSHQILMMFLCPFFNTYVPYSMFVFFPKVYQLYGSQNKYFEYPSYLCPMPCLTFSMHEFPQMTRGRGQKSERDFFFPNKHTFKAGGICLEASEIFPLISGNDCHGDSLQHWLLGRWVKKHLHVPPNILLVAFLAVNFRSFMIYWVPPHCQALKIQTQFLLLEHYGL